MVYFGEQGAQALQFAIDAWPASATASLPAALLLPGGGGPGSAGLGSAAFNDAEWLVEVVTEADQRKEGAFMAHAYADSALKKVSHLQSGGGWVCCLSHRLLLLSGLTATTPPVLVPPT